MKSKKGLLTQRRDLLDSKPISPPDTTPPRSNEKYRNSVAIDSRVSPRESWQGWNRYSVNVGSCGKVPRA